MTDHTSIRCKLYHLLYANEVDSMLEMGVAAICNGEFRSYSCPRTEVLKGLAGVGSYIHDIVVYNYSYKEHLRTLKELFGRLRTATITALPTECFLGENRMEFLGHQIGGDVIKLSKEPDHRERVPNSSVGY